MKRDDMIATYTGDAGEPAIMAGGRIFASMDDLLGAHQELTDGTAEHALILADAYNHFARRQMYEVIAEPERFEADYLDRIASEPPEAEWIDGVVRLRDFGQPDFETIHEPSLAGENMAFFARDRYTGLAYEVSGPLRQPDAARYAPAPLSAIT